MRFAAKLIPTAKIALPVITILILIYMMTRHINFKPLAKLLNEDQICPPATRTCSVANSIIADEESNPVITPRFQFFLHPRGMDQYISDAAYASQGNTMRFFEFGERSYMLRALKEFPGADILDIGANIGTHTLFFGLSGYKVHAFEPLKANFQLLECSVKANEISNIILNNAALGLKYGQLCMSEAAILDRNFGGVHLTNVSASLCDPTSAVKVIPLGEYLEHNNLKPVFMKIDIEGSEFNALSSAIDYLRKYPPKHIYTEFSEYNMRQVGTAPEDYWNLLASLGYKIYNTEDTIHYKSVGELPDTSASNIFIHAIHNSFR